MQATQINEYIKRAHENAVEKGFYECMRCNGTGYIDFTDESGDNFNPKCFDCNGTGKADKNIGELLMLIVSELGEALEAHRKNKFNNKFDPRVDWFNYLDRIIDTETFQLEFEDTIKDTFEDEIADVFIRLFDICGYLNIQPVDFPHGVTLSENVGEVLLYITNLICNFKKHNDEPNFRNESMFEIIHYLEFFCEIHKIEIEKHIDLKMKYNETREYKHGKRY